MNDRVDPGEAAQASATELYGADYYASHCGSVPYERSPYWIGFFGDTAQELIRSLRPSRVFDAGCALGLLVEGFWDRGVEAYGRDISSFAIANVRPDLRQYCEVGSIADPVSGEYDLVTCIEVLEHMPEQLAIQAIDAMAAAAPRIFFSSSPTDFDEPTHINVRPPIYWLRRFAEAGFAPVLNFDGSFLCHHAMLFERVEKPIDDRLLLGGAEIIRLRLETLKRDRQILDQQNHILAQHKRIAELRNPFSIPARIAKRAANALRRTDTQTRPA
jgi:SAM-dependent methyltransferase